MKNTGHAMKYPKGGAVNKRPSNPKVKQDNRHGNPRAKQVKDRKHG
jgi:hypothetical protein